jgi:hypothetical protein
VKIPEIQFPEPTFTIALTYGSAGCRRAQALALRFVLWIVPAGIVDCVSTALARAAGPQPLWLTLMTTYITLALTVLTFVGGVVTVDVRDGGGEDKP